MDKERITIKELLTPDILVGVDGEKFKLLCEYQAKDGSFQSVFVKEGGNDVIIEKGKGSAVVGLFSVDDSKVRQLFDYIEASLPKQDGFVCWASVVMEEYLDKAVEAGGKYPLIRNGIGITEGVPLFYRQKQLSDAFLKEVDAHTLSVEYAHDAIGQDMDDELFYQEHDDDFAAQSKITPAAKLPAGWNWVDYPDGSGHLESPEGKEYFIYDVLYAGYVEFKRDAESQWSVFPGMFEDFKYNAEKAISEHVLEDVGGLQNMDDMKFYVIDDKERNFSIEYFDDVGAALERFQEACAHSEWFPALGVRVGDGSLDLLHGVNGEAVLVPDYRYTWNFSEPMKEAEGDIREAVRLLIEEKWAVKYEYQNDILPHWMQGDVTVLAPATLGNEQKNSYCEGKVLKAELQSGIDAIDSLYIELHGWVSYSELLKHPEEYVADGVIKVPQMNVVYVQEKNVVGMDGRMDIAPCDFKAMVNDINKPYSLIAYDGAQYTGEYRGKHDFIVASYDDAASAVRGWYELQERKRVPALVQSNVPGEHRVVFNGYDENNQRMSFEEAAKKFGINDTSLNAVLADAESRASKAEICGKERDFEI